MVGQFCVKVVTANVLPLSMYKMHAIVKLCMRKISNEFYQGELTIIFFR